jgi:hypothetical protein
MPLPEIIAFLEDQAPGIRVTANLTRFDQIAFIYPSGFRQTTLAIFGPLIKLWHQDKAVAKAILVHEIAHCRHGDAVVIGAGSPFRVLVERWAALFFSVWVVPFTLSVLALAGQFFWEIYLSNTGILAWPIVVLYKVGETIILGVLFAATSLWVLLWVIGLFLPPMMGIWCSELNADQASAAYSRKHTLRALTIMPDKKRRLQWLFSSLAHPPQKLRQWMVAHSRNPVVLIGMLILYPLTLGFQVLILRLWELPYVGSDDPFLQLVNLDAIASWRSLFYLWLLSAVLLALWPYLSPIWERCFSGSNIVAKLEPKPYWISAGIIAVLSLISFTQSR